MSGAFRLASVGAGASTQEQKGFTLIELLIVVVILGVLAAIVVSSVTGVSNTSATSACRSDVKSINIAAESYFSQHDQAASSLAQLVTAGFLHASSNTGASAVPSSANDPNAAAVNADAGIANNLQVGTTYTVRFVPAAAAYPADSFWSTHSGQAPSPGDAVSDMTNCP